MTSSGIKNEDRNCTHPSSRGHPYFAALLKAVLHEAQDLSIDPESISLLTMHMPHLRETGQKDILNCSVTVQSHSPDSGPCHGCQL